MTDYERIKATCLQKRELWEDPDFPATQSSVFYHQTPPFHFVWKRAKEIYSNPAFILDHSDKFDVVPGRLGDKWLVSCLGVLHLTKGLFHRVVPADQDMDAPYAGVFRFRLWWCGHWLEVLVDDRLPTVNGKLAFIHTSHTEQLWPALLEKAYAKLHESYEALKYGSLLDGLAVLTGGIPDSMPLPEGSDPTAIISLLQSTSIVTAHYSPTNETKIKGLELQMNYVYQIEKVEGSEGPVYLIRLGRPLGSSESPGSSIVLDHALWQTIPLYFLREQLTSSQNGFWMLYNDFQKVFSRLEIVHLDEETSKAESTLKKKQSWQVKMHYGGWKQGVSAGGCRNFADFFPMNPQIQVQLPEADSIIISLHQHGIMELRVIGFSIYKLPNPLTEIASTAVFRRIKSAFTSEYTNSRHVSHRCQLDAGVYLVIPTTFEPREEASFSLRIFSKKSLKMNILDSPPKMLKAAFISGFDSSKFDQYEALFVQLADEHRTINAFELQELLDACLPNDYIKSCSSIDTCKQIVLSMDKNDSGRISLADFKELMCSLKYWQTIFKTHAQEKMGVLRAERLRDALKDVGFQIPERAMSFLVLRYMRKDGMLRFGDFVSAVMHLHRVFMVFYRNETDKTGSISLNFSEWLKSALMC